MQKVEESGTFHRKIKARQAALRRNEGAIEVTKNSSAKEAEEVST